MENETSVESQDLKQDIVLGEELKDSESESEDSVVEESEEEEVDYAAEYERLQKELEKTKRDKDNYHKGMVKAQAEARKSKVEVYEPLEREDVDLKEEVSKMLDKKLGSFQSEMVANHVETSLRDSSGNLDEQKLIRYHYENTLQKSGFTRDAIERDMTMAKLLANQSRYKQENEELKAAAIAQKTLQRTAHSSGQKKQPEITPTLTSEEAKLLQRYGATAKDIEE
jgi:hypothetical protein